MVQVNIRIEKEVRDRLKKEAEKDQRTVTSLIKKIIQNYFDELDKKEN